MESMINVKQNDLIYQFLKALRRQLSILKRCEDADPRIFQTVSHFLLHAVVKKDLRQAVQPAMMDPDLAAPWQSSEAQAMLNQAMGG
mmetsp:Transcript_37300/g.45516  ORF Transcript_37300/g.45516 Transcript_37300/m.45516 type:complete len:87 (+) Transcript_37300:264-524(+)